MSPEELKALIDAGEPVTIIDVRDESSWSLAARSVAGARRLDPERIADALGEVPQGEAIVLYCDSPGESTSARAAENLMQRNYTGIFVLRGGWQAWKRAAYPLQSNELLEESPVGPASS